MESLERLGERVRQRRLALDLSQRDAAAQAHVSNQTWLNVENGRGANELSLARIERALEWSAGTMDAILAGTEPPGDAPLDLRVEVERLRREIELLRRTVEALTEQS